MVKIDFLAVETDVWLFATIIRIGFGTGRADRFALCQAGRWKELADSFIAKGKDRGTAARFAKELRIFFDDDGRTLWITFMSGRLYWGMLESAPAQINGQKMPEVERALAASQETSAAAVDLIRMLTPQDFELLVDLVFSTSGWRRVGDVGRTQDTVDFELVLPSTRERAFVQVKSKTTNAATAEYVAKLGERADLYRRMFYVYHSGGAAPPADQGVTLIGPEQLAEMVVDAGLVKWLIEKAS